MAFKVINGFIHDTVNVLGLFETVNVGTGGAALILKVLVTWQLKVSKTVTVAVPGGKPHPFNELVLKEFGVGVQMILEVTDAEPVAVKLTQAIVLVQPACVIEIKA